MITQQRVLVQLNQTQRRLFVRLSPYWFGERLQSDRLSSVLQAMTLVRYSRGCETVDARQIQRRYVLAIWRAIG